MKSNITYYTFTPKQVKIIEELEDLGWEFQTDEWQDGHNGNDYYNFQAKSPRMDEFVNFNENFKSLNELFKRECEWLSYSIVKYNRDYIERYFSDKIYSELLNLPMTHKYKFKI